MVIDHEGQTKWVGALDTQDNYDMFLSNVTKPNHIGVVAPDRETAQKTVDQLNLEIARRHAIKRERRK